MQQYNQFLALHEQTTPLIIPNAWNVASAKAIEKAGFKAIATSSGAIAASLGYADGEQIPFKELLYVVQRIRASTSLPLSVDMERGYTNDLSQLNDHVQQLVEAGVAGINLEDNQDEEIYVKKLSSIRNYLTKNNLSLFINARTDVFLQKLPAPLETTLQRAARYAKEGANGLFVPALRDADSIRTIAAATALPLNIVPGPGLDTVAVLKGLGVRRISMAVLLYKASHQYTEKLLTGIQEEQSFSSLL